MRRRTFYQKVKAGMSPKQWATVPKDIKLAVRRMSDCQEIFRRAAAAHLARLGGCDPKFRTPRRRRPR